MIRLEENKYMKPHFSMILRNLLISMSHLPAEPQVERSQEMPQSQVYFDSSLVGT